MVHVADILKRLYSKVGIAGDTEFSQLYGIPKSTISTWKKRNSVPWEKIGEIVQNANLSLDEIIFGKNYHPQSDSPRLTLVAPDDPVHSLKTVQIDRHFFKTLPNSAQTIVMEIKGDSMAPTLCQGDSIVIDCTQNTPEEGLYVLDIGGILTPKRLQKTTGGDLLLISDNPGYARETLAKEAIKTLKVKGKVILKILH